MVDYCLSIWLAALLFGSAETLGAVGVLVALGIVFIGFFKRFSSWYSSDVDRPRTCETIDGVVAVVYCILRGFRGLRCAHRACR